MGFSCLDSKFYKFLAGIFSTCLLPSWEFVIWWRYWWVSDFQCVISISIIYTTFFYTNFFCWILIDFYGHVMGNDVRKWIPNQKHTKWPHKHHNMSIKLIQKSTRIHVYNFLKEKYQFCWSNALSKQTWWKTLWKSEFVLLPDHYFGNCFLLWMLYKDPDDLSVLYFLQSKHFFNFFTSDQSKLKTTEVFTKSSQDHFHIFFK